MAGFPEAFISELLSRNDIVSIIGEYVELRPKGGRMWGLCPFHGEKTPSFSVSGDKQLYYCFGCHVGGTVVNFLMEMERLSYPETIKLLAQRAGMSLPDSVDDAALQKERALRDRLYAANKEAAHFYYNCLNTDNAKIAADYVKARGIDKNTLTSFGMGYSPPNWQAVINHLTSLGFMLDEIVAAGLATKKSDNALDFFRGRVMFPIIGTYQRVIGFGARALGDEQPKYLNTNETPVFNKRLNLYALNMLKGSQAKYLTVVEGYMDVIGLYQRGVRGCIATLGTALTQQQAKLIKRYVNDVYIAYDGDDAGQNATARAIDILAEEGLNTRIITIPDKKDPDEFVSEYGAEAFEHLRESALSIPAFKLKRLEDQAEMTSEEGKTSFAKKASAYIATLTPIEQERYFSSIARKTGYSPSALKQEGQILAISGNNVNAQRNSLNKIRNTRTKDIQGISPARLNLERMMVAIAAEGGEEAEKVFQSIELFCAQPHIAFLQALREKSAKSALVEMDEESARCIAQALSQTVPQDRFGALEQCLEDLKALDLRERIQELQAEAESDETPTERKLYCAKKVRELRAILNK